jgi:hypothetical protein
MLEHAKHFGRFDEIEGHKHIKLAPPAQQPAPPVEPASVSFEEAKRLQQQQ